MKNRRRKEIRSFILIYNKDSGSDIPIFPLPGLYCTGLDKFSNFLMYSFIKLSRAWSVPDLGINTKETEMN
jgi:hypothetical protein